MAIVGLFDSGFLLQHLQFFQSGDGVYAGCCGFDLAIHVQDLAILPNVKRPAFSNRSPLVNYAIGLSDFLSRIAEDGVVDPERFSEALVLFRGICAGGKVGDIGILERFAILTE